MTAWTRGWFLLASSLAAVGCGAETQRPEPAPKSQSTPLIGGTLAVSGQTAVAADPERDMVFVVDLSSKVVKPVQLDSGAEPARVAIDGGLAHVALRRGGAVVDIDLATAKIVATTPVCAAPRGLAVPPEGGLVVACAGGELVRIAADGSVATQVIGGTPNDVVFHQGKLLVSDFKTGNVLDVGADGAIQWAIADEGFASGQTHAAHRFAATSAGPLLARQRHDGKSVSVSPHGYGASCGGGIVRSEVVSFVGGTAVATSNDLPLLVDVTTTMNGTVYMVAGGLVGSRGLSVFAGHNGACADVAAEVADVAGHAVAIAALGRDIVVQSREPAFLLYRRTVISLSNTSVAHPGFDLFHLDHGTGLACASCHPHGGDDGHTWEFSDVGRRRTQDLRGGVLRRAPFHWQGELSSFSGLVDEVMVRRMGVERPPPADLSALSVWVDALPMPVPALDERDATSRGRALFDERCAACHVDHTSGRITDVGRGEFKVPSLTGIRYRAPFMHDGCARTLRDRFDPACGGTEHGGTFTVTEVDDLVRYLETL